jgi:uncharacterized protein (TIGR01777 family)
MKIVIAGGTGSLGRRLANDCRDRGDDVTILTRSPRSGLAHRQLGWDGRTVGPWSTELAGAVLVNLAGELVDCPPTAKNVARLRASRVEPTRALVEAARTHQPALWLQMSTMAIYGDAGQGIVDESHPVADGPPQMPGVAVPWEAAAANAPADRLVVMRTGIVLDHGSPAFDRLALLTKLGLGGRISSGRQWVSWIHVADFLGAVTFLRNHTLDGIVHLTAPEPVQNRDLMAQLRAAFHRPWSPPTPAPLVHLGAIAMRSDPALALTGRRGVPLRLLDAGFEFRYPTLPEALRDLTATGSQTRSRSSMRIALPRMTL